MIFLARILVCVLLALPAVAPAADSPGAAKVPQKSAVPKPPPRPLIREDCFVQFMIDCNNRADVNPWENPDLVKRGVAIRLATNAWVVFDTETLRYAAGWIGDLDLTLTSIQQSAQGSLPAKIRGEIMFRNHELDIPGLSPGDKKEFKGFHRSHDKIILAYRIGDDDFLDLPESSVENGEIKIFHTVVAANGGRRFEGALTPDTAARKRQTISPAQLMGDDSPKWDPIILRGKSGRETGAYAVDTIIVPENNPWNSWMHTTGLDFLSDGRCAVCTLSGDVWIVSGIDEKLERVSWKRFATGLFEPLGLRVLQDKIYVLGRDRITRLHDLNHDGEADFYENFNSGWDVFPSYHAFNMDLQTDSRGNFYFITCGNMTDPDLPMHGVMLKVSADGKNCDVFCGGMRAANGMAIGPNDEITSADNQGQWTPSSRINWCLPGGFYGYGGDPRYTNFTHHPLQRKPPTSYDPPLCWLPMTADNSSGGQVWVTSDKWGPLKNHLLHTSYGKCSLFDVMFEEVGGVRQAGVVQFPLQFESGIMRARFSPRDGQLYVVGMKGWQTSGTHDGCLQRVRYTGRPLHQPVALHVRHDGIEIGFAEALDPASAGDAENFGIVQYNYLWSKQYGSADYKPSRPGEKGRDTVEIKSARLLPDGKTVFLEIPTLAPVMQMEIKFNLRAADGATLRQEIYNTINKVP